MADIMTGRDPFALDTIKLRAQRYVMSHFGCGKRHEQAYIDASIDMLNAMGRVAK